MVADPKTIDFGLAEHTASEINDNLKVYFQSIQKTRFRFSKQKYNFGNLKKTKFLAKKSQQ